MYADLIKPHVHVHARRAETRRHDSNEYHAGLFPNPAEDKGRGEL